MSDVRLKNSVRRHDHGRGREPRCAFGFSAWLGLPAGRARLRRGADALERDDRPPAGRGGPLRRRRRRDARGALCRRQRPAARGPRRRPQHRGQRGLRGRPADRSFADEVGAGRSGQADRAGRAGRHARRARPGDPGLWPRDPGRHQFHHRDRRAHAGRRLRLDQPQARPHGRQPAGAPTWSPPTASCAMRARANIPTCSGRSAAAAAISAS